MSTVAESRSEPQEFLNLNELMNRWGASAATVKREVAAGRLAKTKIGRLLRFAKSDVLAYESSRRVTG